MPFIIIFIVIFNILYTLVESPQSWKYKIYASLRKNTVALLNSYSTDVVMLEHCNNPELINMDINKCKQLIIFYYLLNELHLKIVDPFSSREIYEKILKDFLENKKKFCSLPQLKDSDEKSNECNTFTTFLILSIMKNVQNNDDFIILQYISPIKKINGIWI